MIYDYRVKSDNDTLFVFETNSFKKVQRKKKVTKKLKKKVLFYEKYAISKEFVSENPSF